MVAALHRTRPFEVETRMDKLRYDLLEEGRDFTYFHASQNPRPIRARLAKVLVEHASSLKAYVAVVDKQRAGDHYKKPELLYEYALSALLESAFRQNASVQNWVVITDNIPGRHAPLRKAIKTCIADKIRPGMKYQLRHQPSMAHLPLQLVDYISWATFRAVENGHTDASKELEQIVRVSLALPENNDRLGYL